MFRTIVRRAAALALALAAACGGTPSPAGGGLALVDDAGDTVRVAAPARRIVSLVPTTTELLFGLGAGDAVVGRTDWCDAPAEAARIPALGDGIAPGLEGIVAARPDLVVLYRSAANAAVTARLRAQGIPTLQLRLDNLDDMARAARLLGRATAREAAADSLLAASDAALASVSTSPGPAAPGAFLLVWDEPLTTIGRGSILADLVTRAGARNVFDDVSAASAAVSLEAVVARAPDVVLSLAPGRELDLGRTALAALPAARAGRVLRLEGSAFLRPTPRAAAAVRELRERLGT